MASPRHRATMENLPSEVLSEIFIRLIAKQLAQMRCVCKPWNALLSESSFVKSHLHRPMHNNDEVLLVFDHVFSFNRKPFTAHPSQNPDLELTNFLKLSNHPQPKCSSCMVIGSVNGLISFICLSNLEIVIYIWNPSLSAVLTLPPSAHQPPAFDDIYFQFGCSTKTDDYKVVKLTSLFQPRDARPFPLFGLLYIVKEWLQVEVYSMKKGSWQLISESPPSRVTWISYQDEATVDGNLHWPGFIDEEMKTQTIVAFDLGAETFREIPLPDAIEDENVHYRNVIGVLAGKLCVMSRVEDGNCKVWVMNEYGVAESWVKHHAFSQFSGDIVPIRFTLRGEFLFEACNNRLVLYDPVAAMSKSFQIMAGKHDNFKIVEYVDSLVWVAPPNVRLACSISQLKL